MSNEQKKIGEGDAEAARNYNESAHDFVKSGKAEQAAEELGQLSKEEEQELAQAERQRDERIKENDPAVKRDYSQSS